MNNKIKKYLFIFTLCIFTTLVCLSLFLHSRIIMGVSLISENELSQYTYDSTITPTFLFNKISAPVDENTHTIYVSQNITETFSIQDLQGTLSVKENQYSLKLVEDEHYNDLYHAMSNNYKFKLAVVSSKDTYTTYEIVFTSLPVVNLNSEFIGLNEEGKASYTGEFSLFNAIKSQGNGYKVETSLVNYHVRGGSSAIYPKKPYKLTFKNDKGENKNLSLLGLGSDDDWILNPMYLDDTKMRDKLCIDIWSLISQNNQNDIKMSSAEYVEVVQNGSYQGIYLLQRRLDKKYLDLNISDTLLKVEELRSMENNLEVIYTSLNENTINEFIKSEFSNNNYVKDINISNYIDVNILTQLGSLYDNAYKNRYFLVNKGIKIILWDTDMSFGIAYENGFVYRFDKSITANLNQFEHQVLLEYYPDLDTLCAKRYFELRNTVLTNEAIHAIVNKYDEYLTLSGVVKRDRDIYGECYNGQDTIENLYQFIDKRLNYLDNFYQKFN